MNPRALGRLSAVAAVLAPVPGCTAPDDPGGGGSSSAATGTADDESSTGEPIADDCIDAVMPGEHVFACSGRDFDVAVPDGCEAGGCGLIVDVHGFTMSAQMQDANTNLRALGGERGYIVIQPNAVPAPPMASWDPAVDDDKVFDFLMRAIRVYRVDEARVHFTGFSQGGYMTWRFACAHADVLASVAPGAACGTDPVLDCDFSAAAPAQPLSILYMHGTADALVPFSCAEPRRDAVVSALGLGAGTVVDEGAAFRRTRYDGDATLEFLQHDYGTDNVIIDGHCFPGSTDDGAGRGQLFTFACDGANDFVWGEAVIDFFEAHPKPQ